ncbi:MAG TPA: hypothetical protein VF042_08585 [Gemmatimonadaceae bacterium]
MFTKGRVADLPVWSKARWSSLIRTSIALCALGAACDNSGPTRPDDPPLLEVVVRTTGGDPDNSYQVIVGTDARTISGFTSTRFNVPHDVIAVQLLDVAPNCTVTGESERSVDMRATDTASVSFEIKCDATGFEIQVQTEGTDFPTAFAVTVDGQPLAQVGPNSSYTMTRLAPRTYQVTVQPPFPNCTAPPAATVDVANRIVKHLDFNLVCAAIDRPELIAYAVEVDAFNTIIEVVGPRGGNTSIVVAGARNPTWAPDGKTMAFESMYCDPYYSYWYGCILGISIVDPETKVSRQIAGGDVGNELAWSPTGDVIAISKVQGGRSEIYLMNLGGQSTKVNMPAVQHASGPAWSPNGDRIAFHCIIDTGKTDICIANRDGTGLVRLTNDAHLVGKPDWSPDGNDIVFARSQPGGSTEIAFIPSVGGDIVPLVPGFEPAWSRDGSTIVFSRSGGLFTVGRNGGEPVQLTRGNHHSAAWRK